MLRSPPVQPSRGIALVTVLVVTSLVLVMALGLALMASIFQLTSRHAHQAQAAGLGARAGIEVAADALAAADWSAVLAGVEQAAFADGAPQGIRVLADGAQIDLEAETARLTCGSPTPCTDAQVHAITRDRPWGTNNPRWRLFAYGPMAAAAPFRRAPRLYLLAWVGDDGREVDGDAARDAGPGEPGAGVVRVRVRAIDPGGGRRDAEAEVVRICRPLVAGGPCRPGVRVHGLRDLRHAVP